MGYFTERTMQEDAKELRKKKSLREYQQEQERVLVDIENFMKEGNEND